MSEGTSASGVTEADLLEGFAPPAVAGGPDRQLRPRSERPGWPLPWLLLSCALGVVTNVLLLRERTWPSSVLPWAGG